ncbi:hypothetical protein WJX77_006910 [Trebouxia sp. C0004]
MPAPAPAPLLVPAPAPAPITPPAPAPAPLAPVPAPQPGVPAPAPAMATPAPAATTTLPIVVQATSSTSMANATNAQVASAIAGILGISTSDVTPTSTTTAVPSRRLLQSSTENIGLNISLPAGTNITQAIATLTAASGNGTGTLLTAAQQAGLADLTRLQLLQANGANVAATSTPATPAAKKSTSIGPIIGGAVGGIVVAVLLAVCLWFVCRRKRNKQVGEKRVAVKSQKQQKQKKQPSGSMLAFLRRRSKKGDSAVGTGAPFVEVPHDSESSTGGSATSLPEDAVLNPVKRPGPEEESMVNPILAITKASNHATTTPNPVLAARRPEITAANPLMANKSQRAKQREAQPMVFNPLLARGSPMRDPPATLTAPHSSEPILASEPVIVPMDSQLASRGATPMEEPVITPVGPVVVDIPPPVESVPEIQAALDDAQPELTLAPIQTPRNTEVSSKDRTRVKPLSGGNNGPVPTALARAQSGSPSHSPFMGFGRLSPAPKKSFTDLGRKSTSRPGSEASGSRRTSPAASPYASPANSHPASPTRSARNSRRNSPANSRASSPLRGRATRPSSPTLVAGRPPKQPFRPPTQAPPPPAAIQAAVAQLAPAQSTPPSDAWIDPQIPTQISGVTGQQPDSKSQQAQAADSAAALAAFPPAKARAVAMRREQEAQTGQQLQQQPLSVSSRIVRGAKQKVAAEQAHSQSASHPQAATSSAALSSSRPLAAIKAPAPSNPKAKILEDLRSAELARAIAPEPRATTASPLVDVPPSKLAFGDASSSSGLIEQPKALTAKQFKALAKHLEDNKPVEDALAVEASLSLSQNTSMSRHSKGAAPETIAEAEPLQDPRAAGEGNQQDMMQSPFAAAAQGKFMARMSAEDMTAMAMGAIDRIRGRAMQPDDLPAELGSPRPPDRSTVRSLSLPKQGSSEDLSAIALAAIARLRNMADKAKESPRSSSAPRLDRVSDFDFERERSQRLRLPAGPVRGSVGLAGPAGPSRPVSPLTGRPARQQLQPVESFPARSGRSEHVAPATSLSRSAMPERTPAARPEVTAEPVFKASSVKPTQTPCLQSGTVTPITPSTPARPTPEVAAASTPPSRSWSPESAVPESVVSAAEVAAQSPQQPTTISLADTVSAPPQAQSQAAVPFEPHQPAHPAEHAEPATPSDSGSDTSGSITVPPRRLVASRVVTLPTQPAATVPQAASNTRVPVSPSASSVSSSVAEEEEEPFVFDEAAAAAKAKEKGKGVLSQPEIRPPPPTQRRRKSRRNSSRSLRNAPGPLTRQLSAGSANTGVATPAQTTPRVHRRQASEGSGSDLDTASLASGDSGLMRSRRVEVHPKVAGQPLGAVLQSVIPRLQDKQLKTDKIQNAENAIADLVSKGEAFAGKYVLETGQMSGSHSFVFSAKRRGSNTPVVCKFFSDQDSYRREMKFFERVHTGDFVPVVLESFAKGEAPGSGAMPACIVLEQWDYSLSDWNHKLQRQPDDVELKSALYMVCKAVCGLHQREIVHGDLRPANVMWFSSSFSMKLVDFARWSDKGMPSPLNITLTCAAPELVAADANGERVVHSSPATDMWALGVLAYEMFAGEALFQPKYSEQEVVAMLLGYKPLPWEANPAMISQHVHSPAAGHLIRHLLQRDPEARWHIQEVMDCSIFKTGDDLIEQLQVSAAQQASSAQRSRQYSLQEIPFLNVKSIGSRGSVLMLAVRFEEVVSRGAGAAVALFSGAVIREMYRTKILSVKEAPMSQSNNNSDDPLFIMHIGATYAVRISVLHGSSHGLMALPVHGVVRVRLQGGRGNDAQEVDVSTLSEEIGKWEGFGIWDTSTHAQPLADRPAQQIKADLTFKLRMKAADELVELHKSIKMKMFLPSQRLHIPYPHQRGSAFAESVPRWAQRAGKGAVSFARLTRQLPAPPSS